MLQRVQTLFLLAAVVLAAGYWFFPFSTKIFPQPESGDLVYKLTLKGVERLQDGGFSLASYSWLLSILCAATAAIPLFAVLQYKRRKLQVRLCWLAVACCLGVVGTVYFVSRGMGEGGDREAVFLFGSFIPFLQFFFLRLGIHRIRKDEALVRSADRIR